MPLPAAIPAIGRLILPLLLSLLVERKTRDVLPGIAGSSMLQKIPGGGKLASILGSKVGGALLPLGAGVGSFFGLEKMMGGESDEEVSSNDTNLQALLNQMEAPPGPSENQMNLDALFQQEVQRRQMQGTLAPALEEMGVDIRRIV